MDFVSEASRRTEGIENRELIIENWKLTEKSYLCKTKNRGDEVSDDTTKRLFPIGLSDGRFSVFDCFFPKAYNFQGSLQKLFPTT